MRASRLARAAIAAVLALWAGAALAAAAAPAWDLPPRLVAEPPGIAQLRAQFAPLTEAQLAAAGYQLEPVYVTAELLGQPAAAGAMGYHAVNPALMAAQFPQGVMDPQRPPIVTLGPDKRVIGVEWEAADRGQPAPRLHGQVANLGPGHPGAAAPHYMLHAYFRPDGTVLFGDLDPALAPPGLPNTGAGGGRGAWRPALLLLALAAAAGPPLAVARRRAARRA